MDNYNHFITHCNSNSGIKVERFLCNRSFRSSSQRHYKYTRKTTVEETLSIISENINDYIRSFYFTETRCTLVPIELQLSSVRPIAYQFHSFSARSFIPPYTSPYNIHTCSITFRKLPGKCFNKIIIIIFIVVINEIIWEMVYFSKTTQIFHFEK